jgi:hypothetical protein
MPENEERWKELCAQAAREQDPVKLAELIGEINRLLLAKRNRLSGKSANEQDPE